MLLILTHERLHAVGEAGGTPAVAESGWDGEVTTCIGNASADAQELFRGRL